MALKSHFKMVPTAACTEIFIKGVFTELRKTP